MSRSSLKSALSQSLPESFKETLSIWAFGLLKIPMIWFVRPKVLSIDSSHCKVLIPLNRRTKNHMGSMYFGALAVGADLSAGLIAVRLIREAEAKVSLAFKDFHAEFLKRAEGDVVFHCDQGAEIQELVKKVLETPDRHQIPVPIEAKDSESSEVVARFQLTLSLKRSQKRAV